MLSQTGLARHFGVSVMSVWRWRQELPDFPPGVEICGRLFWSVAAIERWKAARAANPKPQMPVSKGARGGQRKVQATRRRNKFEAEKPPLLATGDTSSAAKQRGGVSTIWPPKAVSTAAKGSK
jgi:predicted DNA-binding transcriptional regulator AlpA